MVSSRSSVVILQKTRLSEALKPFWPTFPRFQFGWITSRYKKECSHGMHVTQCWKRSYRKTKWFTVHNLCQSNKIKQVNGGVSLHVYRCRSSRSVVSWTILALAILTLRIDSPYVSQYQQPLKDSTNLDDLHLQQRWRNDYLRGADSAISIAVIPTDHISHWKRNQSRIEKSGSQI